jgi:hypothetical protein
MTEVTDGFDAVLLERGGRTELVMGGDLTIRNAGRIRLRLLDAMETSSDLLVRVREGAVSDLSLFQVFCAAHQMSMKRSASFRVEAGRETALAGALRDAGFVRRGGRTAEEERASCPWLAGGSDE